MLDHLTSFNQHTAPAWGQRAMRQLGVAQAALRELVASQDCLDINTAVSVQFKCMFVNKHHLHIRRLVVVVIIRRNEYVVLFQQGSEILADQRTHIQEGDNHSCHTDQTKGNLNRNTIGAQRLGRLSSPVEMVTYNKHCNRATAM